ncbi:hypothetical protein TNCV_48781 [Trichonephila clavipes]|nr:hypothetical protein TNCV_48781 [Trichonephila clavipes]
MVPDGTEFAVGDIERLFDEARRNTKAKHEKWAKYYDRRRRDKCRGDEIVMPSTSGYNLRPRRGVKVEFRPTNEKRTQQRGPVRVRRSREYQYSPYIVEQARSAGRKTRSRCGKQQHCEERKGGTADGLNLGRFY